MEPIAIVGMACRLPGAPSLDDFWTLLRDRRHGIDLIPASRWDREQTFDADSQKAGKINTRHGGFIEGIDLFDNAFFGISPEEAKQMDPQQRIILELAYEAFEDAGLSPVQLEGTDVGVFVGVMNNDYQRIQTAGQFRYIDRYTGVGSGYCMIANRISYQFNLCGPSMAIDSACSSSLVSTFMACESLWMNQCSLALAAGVNLILSPDLSIIYTRSGLSAPDARCRTFSDDATGMGRGEGAGIVVLKRLSDAMRDGDAIYAVIRGGAVNHNGRGNGMSSPNRWAQQHLLRRAHAHAGVAPRDLQYVELHGTGTLIGDAIEATALGSVLNEDRDPGRPCIVGSVKTNLGHLEGAAGVAGLIKLALCLNHGQLVPSLWFNAPNPHIPFDTLPLKVQDTLRDWPDNGQPRLAGISSFGLGGANAHLVLESAPQRAPVPILGAAVKDLVLQISARTKTALIQTAKHYADLMQDLETEKCSAVCDTTLVRPRGHDYRATFVAGDRSEIVRQLRGLGSIPSSSHAFTGCYRERPKRKRIFIFPEFNAIDFGAAEALAEIHPCFKQALAECDAALREVLLRPVPPLLTQLGAHPAHHDSRALPFVHFGVQIAIAALWRAAGLLPDAVAGVGMGRLSACLVSGAIDINSAAARIATANRLGLKRSGVASLKLSRPFLMDCFSSHGKNVPLENSHMLNSEQSGLDLFTMIPDLRSHKEVDYFVISLDADQARLISGDDLSGSIVMACSPKSFWLELARLSIRHNVQWQDFVDAPPPVRLPRYPWQRARYWMENPQAPAAIKSETCDSEQAGLVNMLEFTTPGGPSLGAEIKAPGEQPPTGLDRDELLNLPEAQRRSALATYLKRQVAETLQMSPDEIEEPQTLTGLGIDSLRAFQLKNRFENDLNVPVSLVKLLDGHSIGDLAADLLSAGLQPNSIVEDHQFTGSSSFNSGSRVDLMPDRDLHAQIEAMPLEHIDQMLHQLLPGHAPPQPRVATLQEMIVRSTCNR